MDAIEKPKPAKEVRALYAKNMSADMLADTIDDLMAERFDVSEELSLSRQHIALLLRMEKGAHEKFPGRDDVLMAIRAQQAEAVAQHIKNVKFAREIENSGTVFTADKVAMLLDKIASIVMFRVGNLDDRSKVLDDLADLMMNFRKSYERGTLITPDQDALMMDDTIPDALAIEGPKNDSGNDS